MIGIAFFAITLPKLIFGRTAWSRFKAGPVLGISGHGHPRLEVLPDHVPLEHPAARCDEDGGALFVLRPPSLRRLTRIADRGEQMPPKTTYFSPKPYAGIFLT